MPLIRQYWLARKDKKRVALEPVIDKERKQVDFKVVEGTDVTGDPGEATTSRATPDASSVDRWLKGGSDSSTWLGRRNWRGLDFRGANWWQVPGKVIPSGYVDDLVAFRSACERLDEIESSAKGELPLVPR